MYHNPPGLSSIIIYRTRQMLVWTHPLLGLICDQSRAVRGFHYE